MTDRAPLGADRGLRAADADTAATSQASAAVSAAEGGRRRLERIFVRGPWEMLASVLIGAGVIMLMQPFSMTAYTYSFFVTLVGTVMFIIVSHFPE